MMLNYKMCDLRIQNSKDKLLLLNNLALDARVESDTVNLYGKLNTLLLTYDHEMIYNWVSTNFFKNQPKVLPLKSKTVRRNDSFFSKVLNRYILNGCAEFCQVSALTKLAKRSSSMGFSHMKLILEQAKEKRGAKYDSYFPKLLLSDRHWQTEVLLESLFWTFENETEMSVSKRLHVWRTPFHLGMALVKFGTMENVETKIESLLDTLQLEWSSELAEFVLLGVDCLNQYNSNNSEVVRASKNSGVNSLSIHLALTHLNCFFRTESDNFVVRFNSISVEKNQQTSNVQLRETKLATVSNREIPYNCVRSEDISDYLAYVKVAQIVGKSGELSVNLLEEIVMFWSANFHLKMFYLLRDIAGFLQSLKEMLPSKEAQAQSEGAFNLLIYGLFAFHIKISKQHSAKLSLDNLAYLSKDGECESLVNNSSVISINDSDIFTIHGLNFYKITDSQEIRDERLDNETFQLPWNRTFGITIDVFRAVFPYEHSYAQAVQNDFISIVKWLKILHNRVRAPFPENVRLPSDFLVKIREFLFELSDDPFEVKLRDNFELLEDEYSESLKRQKMLKEKITELTKTHLHLPAGKVEELYASLKKKNAEIYVQRSKQMLLASPPRTRLFAWSMTDVQVMVLADPSIHGIENVVGKRFKFPAIE